MKQIRHAFLQKCLIVIALMGSATVGTYAGAWDGKDFKMPSREALKKQLKPLQFSVTQDADTERPFKNDYWNEHRDGIFVDVVSGEPLFSSKDKYDSGTGWPSFSKPLVAENIKTKEDNTLFTKRTEVRSRMANSHLGHVFDDGPAPTGKRYCMNSAALKFIAKEDLVKAGYPEYASLFAQQPETDKRTVILAGGCFWCMEPPFEALTSQGVLDVQSGYSGGTKINPTYEEVSSGGTGHREVVQVTYDAKKISLAKLLEVYWVNVDPFDPRGEFCDKGDQYTTAIFIHGEEERKTAEKSLEFVKTKALEKGEIQTRILEAGQFYPAEEYHQDYYRKNPIRYKFYRGNCGRDKRLKKVWGDLAHH